MTTALMEPVPIQEFQPSMLGLNEPMDRYRVSFDRKTVNFFFCMVYFLKAGMHTPALGKMYWLETKIYEDKSENVELQRKERVSGFLDCDDAEYDGILVVLKAGIYIRAIVNSMKMMQSGSTRSRIIMGVVDCAIVDSDFVSEIEFYLADSLD
ncbi:hypothetical protein HOY80DRAFT_1054188 [Tuber brumale]|nr:hypothetical protein HOY80DRAFT_1054188 [Tuber brumale]